MMGSSDDDAEREEEEELYEVTLSDFKMSKYEITFEQYDAFCEATNREKPSDNGWGHGKMPVINVSWDDAVAFTEWLGCRLPTEAEWEYACKAGTETPFSTGKTITIKQANFDGNYPYGDVPEEEGVGKTLPVGSYPPNAWGLYDMHGNVGEHCFDLHDNYPTEPVTNPKGSDDGNSRIRRGCGWDEEAKRCRSAIRFSNNPTEKYDYLGFRVVFGK